MRPHWISGGLLRRVERLSWRGLAYGLISPVFATGLWNRSLKPADSTLKNLSGLPPVDHWPGDANRGATIIDGDFELAGKSLRETLSPWSAPDTTPRWRRRSPGLTGWVTYGPRVVILRESGRVP